MLNKDTVKKIVKIQELLANKKDGVLVAHYGAVDPSDMEFNALVVNTEVSPPSWLIKDSV